MEQHPESKPLRTSPSPQAPQPSAAMSSRLPGFYELPLTERVQIASRFAGLNAQDELALLNFGNLSPELTDVFIENAVGTLGMPLGVATNFRLNGEDVLVPMAVEETSVLAAASHGAKLARAGGGFQTSSTDPIMTGQIQLYMDSKVDFDDILEHHKNDLIAYANKGSENLLQRGGGAKDLEWRYIPEIESLVIHLYVDCRDAMGANIVNTMCERLSGFMPQIFPCAIGLRILSNLTDRRLAKAQCVIPKEAFTTPKIDGGQVIDGVVGAYQFAFHDVYRATTNNKGVMNGIDPVVIATGNDWRAIEAGAHAYTCRSGVYRPMAVWRKLPCGSLAGELELPMAVGTVGGVTKLHPAAKVALKLMGNPTANRLAETIVAVGLAQNLSALRALATEGIQKGHMSLHQRNLELLSRQGATRS